jgi:hypothetical protein
VISDLWLLITETDNGLQFFRIFAHRDAAQGYADRNALNQLDWFEDVSGDLRARDEGYAYSISTQPFQP